MYRITVVALPGCNLCDGLVSNLEEANIPYKLVDAKSHNSLCDMLEVMLKTTKYPIAIFEIPERAYFICMPDDMERMGYKLLDDSSTSVGVTSPSEILNTIVELKNKL